jgi:predicted nucleotidyltransferase
MKNELLRNGGGDMWSAPHPMDDPVLAEVVKRLVEGYDPLRIYLFGSQARGEAGPDSDYDLMLVVPEDAPPERRRSRLAYEVLWGTGAAIDVLVWTRLDFDSRLHLQASLPGTIQREGRLIYERGSSTGGRH